MKGGAASSSFTSPLFLFVWEKAGGILPFIIQKLLLQLRKGTKKGENLQITPLSALAREEQTEKEKAKQGAIEAGGRGAIFKSKASLSPSPSVFSLSPSLVSFRFYQFLLYGGW